LAPPRARHRERRRSNPSLRPRGGIASSLTLLTMTRLDCWPSSSKTARMTATLNETHDPARKSFVETANAPDCDFPIQNLPFGVFRPVPGASPGVGVAIGDQVLDVAAASASLGGEAAAAAQACAAPYLNGLMALGPPAWSALRLSLSRALSANGGDRSLSRHLIPMAKAELLLPV